MKRVALIIIVTICAVAGLNAFAVNPRPNPWNFSDASSSQYATEMTFTVPAGVVKAELHIYNLNGDRVLNRSVTAPGGSVTWNGRNDHGFLVSTGVYFYRLQVEHPDGKTERASGRILFIR